MNMYTPISMYYNKNTNSLNYIQSMNNTITTDIWSNMTLYIRQLNQQLLITNAENSKLTRLQREIIACYTGIRMDCEDTANLHGTVVNLLSTDSKLYSKLISDANGFEDIKNTTTDIGDLLTLVMDILEGNVPIYSSHTLIKQGYTKSDINDIVAIVGLTQFISTYLLGIGANNLHNLPIADTEIVFEHYIGTATVICSVGYSILNDDEVIRKK